MCCDTKKRIAAALHTLMQERQFQKITVQDVMNLAKMKRQSFYYHFQDIYDVLEWELDRCFFTPLAQQPDLSLEKCCCNYLLLLDKHRSFYRKAITILGRDHFSQRLHPIILCQIERSLFGKQYEISQAPDDMLMAIDFIAYGFVNYFLDVLLSREEINSEYVRDRVCAACRMTISLRQRGMRSAPQEIAENLTA